MLVFRGTAEDAGATASGRTVGAPMALATPSERPWSTAASTETIMALGIVQKSLDEITGGTYADGL